MILPPLKWAPWSAVHARSIEIHRDCYLQLNRETCGAYDPVKANDAFLDAEDAWCEESAEILGLSLEDFGQLASKGCIEWRENYGQGFEIRYDGATHPMRTRPPK